MSGAEFLRASSLPGQQPIGGTAPVGLAFEIADLSLLQGWAASRGLRTVVEIDHCVAGSEYEEIVVIYAKALARGADGFLTKPVDLAKMKQDIISVMADATGENG